MSSPANSTRSMGPRRQQPQPRRGHEPTLAYGSSHPYGRMTAAQSSPAVYLEMERGPALAPELDNEREEATRRQQHRRYAENSDEPRRGLVKRLFDRGLEGGKAPVVKRPIISAPSAPQKACAPGFSYTQQAGPAPPRPVHPPVELSPATTAEGLREVKAAMQAIPRKPVAVRKENLGTAAHALRSNPVDGADLTRARKVQNRKTAFMAVSAAGEGEGIVEMHPGRSARHIRESLRLPAESESEPESEKEKELEMELEKKEQPAPVRRRVHSGDAARTSRRRGMVINPNSLVSFPEHAASELRHQKSEEREEKANTKKQEPEPRPQEIPALVLTPPREPTPPPVPKVGHLTTDYPYKRLVRQAQRKAELVAREFEPLARALCTAGGLGNVEDVHPDDLLRVLDQVIEDAEGLADVRVAILGPLADDARLTGSDRHDPQILGAALRRALDTRDEAIHAATHHKRRARELKARVAEFEAGADPSEEAGESGQEIAIAL